MSLLYSAVSWVLLRWHQAFVLAGLESGSGLTWALSIICLVLTVRLLLIRVVLKQVHQQRNVQGLQPQIAELKRKFGDDRARQQREIVALQQREGVNPLSGCLPMLLQIPVFIALVHVLRHLSAVDAAKAKLFGAPLAASLHDGAHQIAAVLGGSFTASVLVTSVLVVVSAAATVAAQLLARAGNPVRPVGTAATVGKLMLIGAPLSVLVSGVFFPLGTVLYWCTSNLWTMGQQLYVNRVHPHTSTPAQSKRIE